MAPLDLPMPESVDYRIEFLHEISQLRQCVELQKLVWGFADEDVLPLRSLVLCTKIGGQVLGALDGGGTVVGFLNALPGFRDGQVFLHSHMMAVRPDFQNRGIGKKLKLAQRQDALERGIQRIEWTFDPLEIRNARFNIELLGAVCRRYLVNAYGVTTSRLHGGLPTDRLVAEWHLSSTWVQRKLAAAPLPEELQPVQASVDLPLNVGELKSDAPDRALAVQMSLRNSMLELFSKKFCVTRFEICESSQKATYLFHEANQVDPFL